MGRLTSRKLIGVRKTIDNSQKKQIKTFLHSMLELTNEKGKIKIRDLSTELDVDEKLLVNWAEMMDKRGMLKMGYSISGEPVLRKVKCSA